MSPSHRTLRASSAILLVLTLAGCHASAIDSGSPNATATGSSTVLAGPPVAGNAAIVPGAASIPTPRAAVVHSAAGSTAVAVLATLAVKGRAPMTGYTRARFGPAWTDATSAPMGHNGCGTRDDILGTQLNDVVRVGRCRVLSGSEVDPYTGGRLWYARGRSTVDIDHVAALGDAWQTGAQQLAPAERVRLANDPLNLLAVSSSANRQKGDGDAATWLPKVRSYRCAYVARQVAVKHAYRLWVTPAEHDAIARVLASCPTQQAPTTGAGRGARP
jgi:hypothetical protein